MTDHNVVLRVSHLSKQYRIGKKAPISRTRKQLVWDAIVKPYQSFKEIRQLTNFEDDDESVLWALRDISFDVRQGDILGIMGANGAGKSTLLKILSRIISPSEGKFWYRGTLASLLEVGTGFNGELTGRENIYLNGAILGMKRAHINNVFDEIVAYSGVERFIDTPVKRYSSGMTVRLAFAVAAHLDPDILVLDEVLSVGDAQFSKKSMEKMETLARDGRTVVFVSHSTTAVAKLCHRALFLRAGEITANGTVEQITGLYLGDTSHTLTAKVWDENVAPRAEGVVKLNSVRLINGDSEGIETVDIRQRIGVEISFEILQSGKFVLAEFQITNEQRQTLLVSIERHPEWSLREREPGLYWAVGWIPGNFLAEGRFSIGVGFSANSPRHTYFREDDVLWFNVVDQLEGGSVLCDYGNPVPGLVRPRLDWTGS